MADQIKVFIEDKEYYVVGGQFQAMLAVVKQVQGRRFVSEAKAWQLPGTAQEIQTQIEAGGYQLEGGQPAQPASAKKVTSATAHSGQDRIRVVYQNQPLAVVGGSFQEMLAAVKNLPNRRFDGERKIWEISGDLAGIKETLEAAGFQLEGFDDVALQPPQQPEVPKLAPMAEPPPYESPEFYDDDDIPPYEPPDWWDDDAMPPPPEPVDDWDSYGNEAPANDELFPPDPQPSTRARGKPQGGDQIRIRLGGIPLLITGGSFQEMLAAIKDLPGRRFNGQDKVWDLPDTMTLDSLRQKMDTAGFTVQRG